MTTDYNIDNVDIDDSSYNFSSYINASDGNYTNISVLNITARKAVIFGQNYFTGAVSYASIGDLGGAFNEALAINIPKIDVDPVRIIAALPTAAISGNNLPAFFQTNYIRGNYDLLENNQNIVSSRGISYYGIKNNSNYVVTSNRQLLEIGRSRRFNTSVPNIFTESQWKQAEPGSSHVSAIQSDGTLWSWGSNGSGQLGLGDLTSRSSPVQVGSLSVWTQVSPGGFSTYAIQSNGTLWSWGNNSDGQLGLNTSVNTYSSPLQVGTLSNWSRISGGFQFPLAIQSNGTLWSWGANASGQLGLNTTTFNLSSPVQVGALSVWTQVSAGASHSVAIQSNGTLWTWGNNAFGQLGLSDLTTRSSPVQVGALLWKKISAGASHILAIQSNGTLWAWGRNNGRQLGITNAGLNESSPNQVGSLSTWTQVSAGYFNSAAIQSDGTLWIWGVNSQGILGNNTIPAAGNYSTPVQVGILSNWSQVNCFESSTTSALALQSNGYLWTWGSNGSGQLGFDSTSYRSNTTQVGLQSFWSKLPGGSQALAWSLVIDNSNTLYGFGDNTGWVMNYQQATPYYDNSVTYALGDGQLVALPVPITTNISSVSSGSECAAFIKTDGTLWSWGNNTFGQLALSASNVFLGLLPLAGDSRGRLDINPFLNNKFGVISSGLFHGLAIQSNGTLWAWGSNTSGQLGLGDTVLRSSPVQVGNLNVWKQISSGSMNSVAIQSNGTLWSWGNNSFGQLGLNTLTNYSSPVQVGSLLWKQVTTSIAERLATESFCLAIQSNGTLWSWGYNINGMLGLSDLSDRSSPVQVGALSNWSKIAVGLWHTLALQSDGTLWSWGNNFQGQLGSSNITNRSSPVQVGALLWKEISAGYIFSAAIQSNGTLWTWGNNSFAQLGLNLSADTSNRSSPMQIGSLSTWTKISCGDYHILALQSDGTLWAWGSNSFRQTTTTALDYGKIYASSPTQVGALSVWTRISAGGIHSFAGSSDGGNYLWGSNSFSQLGRNDFIYSPTQVGTFSDWTQVVYGTNHALALRSGGQLYAWGGNSFGQAITVSSFPTQIGSLTNWNMVAAGDTFSAATKNDGTLWAWGNNSYGQLGQGDYTHRSSPVQVGTISQYVSVYAMSNTLLANLF